MKKIYIILCFMLILTACGNNIEKKDSSQINNTSTQTIQDIKKEGKEMKLKIEIGENTFFATLQDNSSVDALKKLIEKEGSLTLTMSDYANMEKGVDLGVTLPENNENMHTQAGDIILFQGRTFVIYYDENTWSLTPIGKIDDVKASQLRKVLGDGDVEVTLSLQ